MINRILTRGCEANQPKQHFECLTITKNYFIINAYKYESASFKNQKTIDLLTFNIVLKHFSVKNNLV